MVAHDCGSDETTDGLVEGGSDGWVDGLIEGPLDGQVDRTSDGRLDGSRKSNDAGEGLTGGLEEGHRDGLEECFIDTSMKEQVRAATWKGRSRR